MLPLFKSHYSIGKSILTLDAPDEGGVEGPDSIFDIALDNNISELILVEDSLTGFMQAIKVSDSAGVNLIFGLRLSCHNHEASGRDFNTNHKVIVFAKDKDGCRLLNQIYTHAFCVGDGAIKEADLLSFWDSDHLKMAIPFYDSFIFNNLTILGSACSPFFGEINPTFFVEDNLLPFDALTRDAVLNYCAINSLDHQIVKSIYYKDRSDFEAYQTHKCVCGRSFSAARSLSTPKQDHLASNEFCFESYLDLNTRG